MCLCSPCAPAAGGGGTLADRLPWGLAVCRGRGVQQGPVAGSGVALCHRDTGDAGDATSSAIGQNRPHASGEDVRRHNTCPHDLLRSVHAGTWVVCVCQVTPQVSRELQEDSSPLRRLQWLVGCLRHGGRTLLSLQEERARLLHAVRFLESDSEKEEEKNHSC